ncbi:hypothetical protein JCM10207_005985 [Rhodosporidiobolus poonsookiae]
MSSQAVASSHDASKSLVTLLLSVGPLVSLLQFRSQLGLDRLHVGLLQVLLLLFLRAGLDSLPTKLRRTRRRSASPPPVILVEHKASPSPPVPTPTTATASKKRRTSSQLKKPRQRLRPTPPAALPPPPPPYPAAKLDETVANFLSITAPAFLAYLPCKPTTSIPPAPLAAWTSTYQAGDLEVLQHPTAKGLFGICATYPELPLRRLYQTLQSVEERAAWDSMTQGADEVERFEAGDKRANVMHMKMKGMAMVKAKDLVLLSVAGTLPLSSSSTPPDAAPIEDALKPVADKLRIFAATTSVIHPKLPPTPEFNRMELSVSGFLIEEVGAGSRIVQITDLSGLGSWIPSAVIRTITQTMLPKSLIKLGAAAATCTMRDDVQFPPPTLGAFLPAPLSTVAIAETPLADDSALALTEDDLTDDEDDASTASASTGLGDAGEGETALAPSASRDLHALLTQLRSLTTRLSALETLVSSPASSRRPWYSPFSSAPPPSRTAPGAETKTLNEGRLSALFTLGSAAGAAGAVAVLAWWGRRGSR